VTLYHVQIINHVPVLRNELKIFVTTNFRENMQDLQNKKYEVKAMLI